MKNNLTYSEAKENCENLGMQLVRPGIPSAATPEKTYVGQMDLKASEKAFVAGMKRGRCNTLNGKGMPTFDDCAAPRASICEYNDEGKLILNRSAKSFKNFQVYWLLAIDWKKLKNFVYFFFEICIF